MEEGLEKVAQRKLVSYTPSWLAAITGHLLCGRTTLKKKERTPSAIKIGAKFTIACWNIRTLLDTANSNRSEHRSALVAHELLRLSIDVAALSEVRIPEEGSLREHGAGYTLYWKGKPKEEKRLAGVGFMVRLHCLQTVSPTNRPQWPHHVHAPFSPWPATCHSY